MNIKQFESGSLVDFRRKLCRTTNFWLFHHLPKTAGTSMTYELNALLPPYYNIHRRPALADKSWLEAVAIDTRQFLARHAERPFRSASGHLRPPEIRAIRQGIPETKVFTLLRHPVAQVISQYRYSCTPAHRDFERHIARYPTIEHWLDDPRCANAICGFLSPPKPLLEGNAEKIIQIVKSSYTFVGLVEEYDLSFRFITALMFAPVAPRETRVNQTLDTGANRIDVSDSLRERIVAVNHLDMKLYEAFSSLFQSRREEIRQFVADLGRSDLGR